ncbi:protein L [Acetobacter sp. LMG 1627]|uniref:Protein L n=1 Tax=Acetobacter conturbans TaxID=1737472 RepID=A0ABX0JYU4_9PROT|nr:protein L [Acetobacter conturbans]
MALYKYPSLITSTNDSVFDSIHTPGSPASHAGIYRCEGCGREMAIAQGHSLPPQNHHEHTQNQGLIRWRLIVLADHRPH